MSGGGAGLGLWLENAIEVTNRIYRARGLADVEKRPTPYRLIREGNKRRLIRQKSTVDYGGAVAGIPVVFDAKSVKGKSLPHRNVHEHQLAALQHHQRAGGVGFLLVAFGQREAFAVSPQWYAEMISTLDRVSIPLEIFQRHVEREEAACVRVRFGAGGVPLHYAPAVMQLHLLQRMHLTRKE